jgi:uncharacterized protein
VFYFDPLWIVFMAPALLLSLYAQSKVRGTYSKYSRVANQLGAPAAEMARRLLDSAGLSNVDIRRIPGNLTDNYDPRTKVLNLSEGTYGSNSVAALGVAAHECGHAIQDAQGYAPMKLRSGLVPLANIGSTLGYILIFGGFILQFTGLIWVGIAAFSFGVFFSLATLPVELNASSRAMTMLSNAGLVDRTEYSQARSVLNAAAWTYVAAAAAAVLNLLYFVTLAGRRN